MEFFIKFNLSLSSLFFLFISPVSLAEMYQDSSGRWLNSEGGNIYGDSRYNIDADPRYNINADPRYNIDADPRYNIDADPRYNICADPRYSLSGC